MNAFPDFETPKLAEAVEALEPAEIDALPFGATLLDSSNIIRIRNRTEAETSGLKDPSTVGRLYFVDVAPCLNNGYFKGKIDKARKNGTLDITFTFVGDFSDSDRELTVRAQSARDGGTWIFIRRS